MVGLLGGGASAGVSARVRWVVVRVRMVVRGGVSLRRHCEQIVGGVRRRCNRVFIVWACIDFVGW